jgi:transketolase
VVEIDGNQINDIIEGFKESERNRGKPTIIIIHTQMGQRISFMEWICSFHEKALSRDEMTIALQELGGV